MTGPNKFSPDNPTSVFLREQGLSQQEMADAITKVLAVVGKSITQAAVSRWASANVKPDYFAVLTIWIGSTTTTR